MPASFFLPTMICRAASSKTESLSMALCWSPIPMLTIKRTGLYARATYENHGEGVMKNKFALMVFGFSVLSLTAAKAPLYAHHGFEFEYDTSKYVTITGTLTKVE